MSKFREQLVAEVKRYKQLKHDHDPNNPGPPPCVQDIDTALKLISVIPDDIPLPWPKAIGSEVDLFWISEDSKWGVDLGACEDGTYSYYGWDEINDSEVHGNEISCDEFCPKAYSHIKAAMEKHPPIPYGEYNSEESV